MTPEEAAKTLKKGTRVTVYGRPATVTKSWTKKYPKWVSIQYHQGADKTSVLISEVKLQP